MCIAILQPIGKKIPKENLSTSWDSCDDGAGCMFVYKGKLHVHKEIHSFEAFYTYYQHIEKLVNDTSPIVLHFRMKTHGAICLMNTHPHWVNDKLWFVHNGIISTLPAEIPADTSDSISFSQQILQKLPDGFHLNPVTCILLEKYIGTNKLIFLDEAGNTSIINEKLGIWDNDIWYSNTNYKKYATQDLRWSKWEKDNEKDFYGKSAYSNGYAPVVSERCFSELNKWGDALPITVAPSVTAPTANTNPVIKDCCLFCQEKPLVTTQDKQFAVCALCRELLCWGGQDDYDVL